MIGLLSGCATIPRLTIEERNVEIGNETAISAPLTVAAAADLQFAFTEIAEIFEQETGQSVTLVFGSTGQLAQQIENGAPFDLYAAANVAFVEQLNAQGLVLEDSIALYARGRIVLAVNRESGVSASTLADLLDPSIRTVAIANPAHAPYGVAAQQALESEGVWGEVQSKLVLGENVRQTLQYIQTGDAEAGIIALSIANVAEISWTLLDEDLHQPLDQALAVVASTPQPEEARAFAALINSERGRPIMQKYGFVLPGEEPAIPTSQP
ncbi:MAG: molybdate ABC transporter substrate-binding protein [Caldilineaceae bacterium]|nr:molybdate ABC transporter substrate-binding protein [Caldilineaceae bacterium]